MKIESAVLKRLGPIPFWRGERKCLDELNRIYRKAAAFASDRLGAGISGENNNRKKGTKTMKNQIICGLTALASAVAVAYPKPYAADASTPELRAALTQRLWAHDAANDVRIWPADRLREGADRQPYAFKENELDSSNLVIGDIVNPQFTIFRAKGEGPRPAVVVFPGGGYRVLGWNKEGTEVAEWLNSLGFTAVVLLYRTNDRDGALCDAQRTMGILRRDARGYGIDPRRLGVIGFSAGANLAVRLATNWRQRAYPKVDNADDWSCRPDFMLPIYPWDLRPRNDAQNVRGGWQKTIELDAAYPVDAETPPAFTVQAMDDHCEVETAVGLDYALRKAGVASELRVYRSGGHGYGLRRLGTPCDVWRDEAAGWLARFAVPRKRVAFLGDSITDPWHVGCTKNYWGYLEDDLGIEPLVYGLNGHQMCHLLDQADRLAKDVGDKVDEIVVFAGTNDFNANVPLGEWYTVADATVNRNGAMKTLKRRTMVKDDTFRGRINRLMERLHEKFPKCRIVVATPIHRGYAEFGGGNVQPDETYANELGLFIDDYVQAVKEAGNVWAVTVVDLNALSGLYPLADSHVPYFHRADTDRLHPSDAGHRRMADALKPWL